MKPEFLRYFVALNKGIVHRIYVTPHDLLFAELNPKKPICQTTGAVDMGGDYSGALGLTGGMMFGAFGMDDDGGGGNGNIGINFDRTREIEAEGKMLDQRNEEGIRIFIQAGKRGFIARPKELDEACVDLVGRWRYLFFGKPRPAFIFRHRTRGNMTFIFQTKYDAVIGLYELQNLFKRKLDIQLNLKDYKKGLRKYAKMQSS